MSGLHSFIKVSSSDLLIALGYKSMSNKKPIKHPNHCDLRGWIIKLVGDTSNQCCFEFTKVYHSHTNKANSAPMELTNNEQRHCNVYDGGDPEVYDVATHGLDFFHEEMFKPHHIASLNASFDFFFLEYGNFNETIKYCNWYYFSHATLNFENSIWKKSHHQDYDILKIICGGRGENTILVYEPAPASTSSGGRSGNPPAQPLSLIAPPCPPHWIPETLKKSTGKIKEIKFKITESRIPSPRI